MVTMESMRKLSYPCFASFNYTARRPGWLIEKKDATSAFTVDRRLSAALGRFKRRREKARTPRTRLRLYFGKAKDKTAGKLSV
jgi:hypothetical protein